MWTRGERRWTETTMRSSSSSVSFESCEPSRTRPGRSCAKQKERNESYDKLQAAHDQLTWARAAFEALGPSAT